MSVTADPVGAVSRGARRGAAERGGRESAASSASPGGSMLTLLFIVALVLPFTFYLGPMRLSPYRVMLLVMIVPLFFQWVGGAFGKPTLPDVLIVFSAAMIPLTLMLNHGFERIAFGGITAVEMLGAYLLGRAMIRDADSFAHFVRCLILALLLLIPFVAMEAVTGNRLLSTFLRGDEAFEGMAHAEKRWGMWRAQGPFGHPILFGVFASSGVALAYYVLGAKNGPGGRVFGTAVALTATFFSLSMGAFLAVFAQIGLIGYDMISRTIKDRWKLLLGVALAVYFFFYLFSHRGLTGIVAEEMSFNTFAASVRLHTWNYGFDAAMGSPIVGLGFAEWSRPGWLTSSVDNFWLLNTMRYGFPATIAMIAAFIMLVRRMAAVESSDPIYLGCRMGFITALVSLAVSLSTVHSWDALYSYMFFLIGGAAWMTSPGGEDEGGSRRSAPSGASGRGDGAPVGRAPAADTGRGRSTAAPAEAAPAPELEPAETTDRRAARRTLHRVERTPQTPRSGPHRPRRNLRDPRPQG